MSSHEPARRGLAPRQIIGLAIAVVSLVLIAANWDDTEVSLVVTQVTMPLAILLAIVFVGGMATGALVLRRRQARGST
jgi:uncharacterized integral membrane protein